MKTKIAALMLAAAMVITTLLCGCSGQPEPTDEPLAVVGFSQVGAESEWRVANTEDIKSALSEENGFELIYADAQQKQENQIRDIRGFIQQRVDYIVLSPITETGWDTVLEEAKAAGIDVILVDRMVKVSDESLYKAYVGSNFRAEGDRAVSWLEHRLSEQGRSGEDVNIVHIQGTLGSSPQLGRSSALDDGVERNPGWHIIAQEDGDFTRSKAYEVMNSVLEQTEDVDVVYCENDGEAFGVIDALEEHGISYGRDGVIIISFDATRMALGKCLEGKINFVAECNALQGSCVADIITSLENGEDIEKISFVSETQFDCDTITQQMIDCRKF